MSEYKRPRPTSRGTPHKYGRNAAKHLRRRLICQHLHGKPGGWKRALRNRIAPWWGGTDCGNAGLSR